MNRKDFKIELENHTLSISAEKGEEKKSKEENNGYSRREYSYNSFARYFELPENVKEVGIDARYDKGILTVTVPKAVTNPTKPVQKIAVT